MYVVSLHTESTDSVIIMCMYVHVHGSGGFGSSIIPLRVTGDIGSSEVPHLCEHELIAETH